MRRALPFAFVILPALAAATLVGPSAATPPGTITFTGRVIDGNAPLAPGRIVTVHGAVIARSETCVEARVDLPSRADGMALWLCSQDTGAAADLPDIGEPIAARARISGVRVSAEGAVPFSDSFVLMRSD